MPVSAKIRIDGIQSYGTWSNPDPYTKSLYVPLEDIQRDWNGTYQVHQAGKIGNDVVFDVSTNLITYPLVKDYSAGAFKKDYDRTARRYYLPSPYGTGDTLSNGPLCWTARPDAPIMCGCGWAENNGTYSFKEMDEYNGSVYAIDYVGKKVYKLVTGTWTNQASAALTKTPTEMYNRTINGTDRTLVVGQGANGDGSKARKFDGSSWSDFAPATPGGLGFTGNAQHFTYVDNELWFTTGNQLVENVNTNPHRPKVGDNSTAINRILWDGRYVIITKPEGVFYHDPTLGTNSVRPIILSSKNDPLNGQFLIMHNGMAWFNFNNRLYAFKGGTLMDRTFAVFEGAGVRPFYSGQVIGGYSAGDRMFIWFKVNNGTSYDYYLCVYTGDSGGFHPIFFINSATNPTNEPAAVLLNGNYLYYSISNDVSGNAKTGFIVTDGYVPIDDGSTHYTRNVAVTTGWVDFDREGVTKWFQKLLLTVRDQGTTGSVTMWYKKWGDATWTLIGSTTAGSQDNFSLTIPAETGSQAGITANKVMFKVGLTNSSANPTNAWYADAILVVGVPTYNPAYHATIRAWLKSDLAESGLVAPSVLLDAIRGAMQQGQPVVLYHPDGNTFKGHIRPISGQMDVIDSYDRDAKKVKQRHLTFGFIEAA